MNLETNPYTQDILSQPEALRTALARFDATPLQELAQSIRQGVFERLVLTGMGASFYAAYPAWLQLIQSGLPAYWLDAAELIHHASGLLHGRTLLWVCSQSGRSAEIIALLERIDPSSVTLLATVNDLSSPLAQAAGRYVIPLWAEAEVSVSTSTYLNTLALSQLTARVLGGLPTREGLSELYIAANSIEIYLSNWHDYLQIIREHFRPTRYLVLLGRGPSLAAVYTGALILAEAAKVGAIALGAGEFRHGPLELADANLIALLFAGGELTQGLMARLYDDLLNAGARPFWIAPSSASQQREAHIPMPQAEGLGAPLAEIIPIQLLSLHLALEQGFTPGEFRHIAKVTLSE